MQSNGPKHFLIDMQSLRLITFTILNSHPAVFGFSRLDAPFSYALPRPGDWILVPDKQDYDFKAPGGGSTHEAL